MRTRVVVAMLVVAAAAAMVAITSERTTASRRLAGDFVTALFVDRDPVAAADLGDPRVGWLADPTALRESTDPTLDGAGEVEAVEVQPAEERAAGGARTHRYCVIGRDGSIRGHVATGRSGDVDAGSRLVVVSFTHTLSASGCPA